ncbi:MULTISPECIES: FAD-dependent oxidoreductase [Haloarcula]|uniref:FAD-dependent oxidoreductase n=1 Tax=Haloarcula TaxID=2237 RepID=UPI0023E8E409|nr:FAD-dependent oxidoreductase [Halomicroarcula sp. SHR3]
MTDTFVVVGGDAAGMSAASKAKRADPEMDVIVFEQGEWVSYAACGMPYFIKGDVQNITDLVAVEPETFREERDIDLRTGHEVVDIDPDEQVVTVVGEDRFEQPYDDLLVATGATAVEPPFDGMDLDGVFTLHDMDEAAAIEAYLAEQAPETAAVVGGGYVGIEIAEALADRDIAVHLYEMLPSVLQPFGETVGEAVAEHLREQGVQLHLETAVSGFAGDGAVERVHFEDEDAPADVAVVGVGVAPNVDLAADAGVELGPTGAIATDEYGRTNLDNVFAAGDTAEMRHTVTDEPAHVPLALTANRAGRAIGQTVAGSPTAVGPTAGTAIVKAFDLGAARTGVIDEERAREAGFDPVSVTISAPSRAHYYPDAAEVTVTLVADGETGRLLGGSIVGREGVKRIDTVAMALHADQTVSAVQNADLAYAPPFSPVWDPVLTAAKVLGGKLD